MKVSLNWVRQFTNIDMPVDELVAKIGEQLGAVEEVIDIGKKYEGVVIAKVIKCEKHQNADKLSVCLIDDGGAVASVERNEDGLVQVVCGASNVKAGMRVVWLPPGVTVPASYAKAPFALEARELRGKVSNGMLASASELVIGDDHSGIVSVDIDAEPGRDFAEVYELNDTVIDIENKMFTHRPDCFGILGVAREIAGIQGVVFQSPEWYTAPKALQPEKNHDRLGIEVSNNLPDLVPRFMAVAIDSVVVKPSPLIMQTYLSRLGIRPINNIVDVTNYIMALTGQPLHAYDYDKLKSLQKAEANQVSLETRLSKQGDILILLGGKEITFEDENTVLITSNDVPVGIGGVMGGADTEVGDDTTRIVLECANFDMYSIRKTSMRHGLFTDAVTRFNKGQSALQNDRVLQEAVATLEYVSGASLASNVIDKAEALPALATVEVTTDFINARLGLFLSAEDIAVVLKNVEFNVHIGTDSIHITAPFWRTDIVIPEDIVEEVGRLIGFDKLPLDVPTRSISPVRRNESLDAASRIRDLLASAGAHELLTYSFVSGALLEKSGQSPEHAFRISNALSPGLEYYRMSLTPSLLDKVHQNIKAGFVDFVLFEIGKVHIKGYMDEAEPSVPAEEQRLAVVFSADDKQWNIKKRGAVYYQGVQYVDWILSQLGVEYNIKPFNDDVPQQAARHMLAPFEQSRSGFVLSGDVILGVVGEIKTSVRRVLKLPKATVAIELDLTKLMDVAQPPSYVQLSRYPKVQQDISFTLPAHHTYQAIYECVRASLQGHGDMSLVAEPLDIYQPEKDASSKHVAFRITAVSANRTLTDEEVGAVLSHVASQADRLLAAERL
ncbi:phenylalanine--tRNA ligase subunit beta [soil metagenome]